MANNTNPAAKIASIAENVPLAEILDTMEIVMSFVPIPGGPIIVKVLRILIKVQPAASKSIQGIAKMQQGARKVDDLHRYASFIPSEDTPQLSTLRLMVDIALEDGELTDEELALLIRKAEELGLDTALFEMGVKNALAKVNQNK